MQLFKKIGICSCLLWLSVALPAYAAVLLKVPFTSQAPSGHWGQPYRDFCEEASVVMAAHFLWDVGLTPEIAELEMKIIQSYETLVFGRSKDTSVDETASILRMLYGFKHTQTLIIDSVGEIKDELRTGHIVVVPVAGRLLKNSYFTPPVPLYHMLVIRGFDDADGSFITNDPGTRRGNGLKYPQTRLFGAIHDWNGGDVLNGEKRVMIVNKK